MTQMMVFRHDRFQFLHMLLLIGILLVDQLEPYAAAVFACHLP